ncbi:MAG: AAC(3) family N-acetyltransferase, partial [Lentisphaeria bacterium]|nr:AAC(3) family N-acetyltransferase [Lentisphaeria bacterium]
MLADALRQAGVREGDVLLVHSSLSKCGYVSGGAKGLIEGVMEAVGKDGTALFPTFTRPYIYLGTSLNKGWNYRPYD